MLLQTFFCLFLAQSSGFLFEEGTKCFSLKQKSSKLFTEVGELAQHSVEYTCPRDFEPKTFTKCCHNGECCEPTLLTMAPNNDWVLMVSAILVICSCLILTVLAVVCCFWSKCPLYNACRPNYTTSNVIVYSLGKEDPTPLMPGDGAKGQLNPYAVKIKRMQDV